MWILALLLALVVAYLVLEDALNRRRLARIRHRIYVNGTRGKSSVTRLIAAALREGGVRTIAKTTGSSPRFIFPDGSEVLIRRLGQTNIKEQLKVMRWTSRYQLDAVVVECMALAPFNQWVSQHRMVQGTIGVMTNARADHLDVMGPTVADVEKALAGTVPKGGVFVTAERTQNRVFQQACRDLGSEYDQVTDADVAAVTPRDLAGFSYIEHAENVALALKVSARLGVARDVALRGMQRATPDIGVLTRCQLDFYGRRIVWVNGFAANDPDSYRILWKRLRQTESEAQHRIVVVNCRDDRPDRSRQLGDLAAELDDVDLWVLVGSGTEIFARAALQAGVDASKLYTMVNESIPKMFERIVAQSGASSLVFGIGNIKGDGKALDEYFTNRARLTRGDPAG
jgi:poly-gamma-glutamate synthase PgsB/CapB